MYETCGHSLTNFRISTNVFSYDLDYKGLYRIIKIICVSEIAANSNILL